MATTGSGTKRGLSDAEAAARLAADGPNALPQAGKRGVFAIVGDVLREPMLALLLGGGAIYLLLGSPQDAVILICFAALSVAITVVQELRTERVLDALRDLTSPRALVVRGGERIRIAGRDVVRGDLIVVAEGDRVPADAVLREASDLLADESLLTGESVPVRKIAAASETPAAARPGGDDLPFVYSGSLIVRGTGLCEATATGARSEIGKIGASLGALENEPPRLRAQVRRAVRGFAVAGGAVSLLAVLLYGLARGDWLQALLAGIALGMSMLPEEFPVVLTVFMAMGAWRISRARVLTRRAAAIETLGAATVLCTDKTGTLTENRMTIVELRAPDGAVWHAADGAIPPGLAAIAATGLLASAPSPADPMERAFHALGGVAPAPEGAAIAKAYGLRAGLLAVTQAWKIPGAAGHRVAVKGAPEAVAGLCGLDLATLAPAIDAMAAEGLRVLGVAHGTHGDGPFPETPAGFKFEFLGFVGLADPLRGSVKAAVAQCRSAGIKVKMITGDYPSTALAIAREAGIDADTAVTGEAMAAMDDAALDACAKAAGVFARIMPEQKLRIVEALKRGGETVAMTGDGVNDAPSLKAAHIGIAMGGRGTDVAREAAAIVLLDDDFGAIVSAVRLGRRIYDNLRKAMGFIFAVHVPIAGLSLLPLALGLPPLFAPVHIAFLEMVIDPVCALVFEAETEEDDTMRRKPRDPGAPLFSRGLVGWGCVQGLAAFAVTGAIYLAGVRNAMAADELRALTFFSLVVSIVALILVNRAFGASLARAVLRPNRTLALVAAAVAACLAATMLIPAARDLFRFGPLHAADMAVVACAGIAMLLLLEGAKLLAPGENRKRSW